MDQYPKLEKRIEKLQSDFIEMRDDLELRYDQIDNNTGFITEGMAILTNRRDEKLIKDRKRRARKIEKAAETITERSKRRTRCQESHSGS